MSAFCVYGASRRVAMARAEKKVKVDKLPLEERHRRVLRAADDIFAKMKPVQVSPQFDAPQFAWDWIKVALKSGEVKFPVVMVRTRKVDEKGRPVISKRTEAQQMIWAPYKP